jgi:predicted phosphodiesterase
MKYAVISDIHANLEALSACLKKIEELKPDKIICLGDLVDYCAQPNECIDLVKNNCDVTLLGNHDEAQFNYPLSDGFTSNARVSSIHTRLVIKPEHIEYLKTLPYVYREENILFVHGSPYMPEEYNYVLTELAAQIAFESFDEQFCFIGHSHRPVIFEKSGKKIKPLNEKGIKKNYRYIINAGSVGQPRDGDPRLSFGAFDSVEHTYSNIRLPYPAEEASKKIIFEGLPVFLAERILKGV